MSLPLFTLFLAAFAMGTAEFVIAGVLPDVAAGLDTSISLAGLLVTGYAIGIAVGGPTLAIVTRSLPRKTVLVGFCALFTLGQALCAIAPTFELLLLARVLVAAVHGAYFGIAAIVAVELVPQDKRGFAVALLLSGLTVSNVIGVPAGTAIGNALGWRATFWTVAALGLAASVTAWRVLPYRPAQASTGSGMLSQLKALGRQQVLLSLLIAVLVMIGQYSLFTYIAPLLTTVTGIDDAWVPAMLLLFGTGATTGVFIGGRLADWKLIPSLIAILALQGVMYACVYFASPYPVIMAIVIFLWGGASFAFGSPLQSRILRWAADAPNLASTMIPTAFNIGIAIGAAFASALIGAGFGYRVLPGIGVGVMVFAVAVAILSALWESRRQQLPPAYATAA
ncbi:MFS transporter [Devosia pacifica]|uniref:MFS transporter n=1 Tax=Devosia pacifica TaxID=1335967 RepID=A0A918RXU9_9HYPH|nr:MFS transporter [Devosia pacifica]GHA16571.1 MFS transporter [Devosia pacifica]